MYNSLISSYEGGNQLIEAVSLSDNWLHEFYSPSYGWAKDTSKMGHIVMGAL